MKLELSLHAVDLKNVAGAFKGTSDPFAVVTHVATEPGQAPTVLGKTEVVKNNLSPQWVHVFVFDYEFGTPMKLVISIFDEVRKGDNKSMGTAIFEVGELLGARGQMKAKALRTGGKIIAQVRKSEGSGLLRLQMKASKLKNTEGFLRKSDPFFELSREVNVAGGQTWDNVFRSPVIKNNLNPEWKSATIPLSILCGGNLDAPIRVTIYDHESKGDHVFMGQFETTVNGLAKAAKTQEPITVHKKGSAAGTVIVTQADVVGMESNNAETQQPMVSSGAAAELTARMAATNLGQPLQPNFVDYLSGGLELNVMVAIDFTGSNGNPRVPGTLHYLGEGKNDYERAIEAILSILSKYDHDQMFPVLGFGAKYSGVVNHCFQCGPQPEAKGVKGVLDAYRATFQSGLIMSSPTDVTKVIESAAAKAQKLVDEGKHAYEILLIVTDGAVTDVQATADCINRVSDKPLSIFIVGVGDDDFSAMEFLDNANKSCRRDIVQFVQFNKHKDCRSALTSATLKELPDHVVSYFQSKNIRPKPGIMADEDEIVVEQDEEEIDLSLDIGEGDIKVSGGGVQMAGW